MDPKRRWETAQQRFANGNYWDCHEILEPLWLPAKGLDKAFYGGVILLAAALHKARVMNSARGGRRNYAKALTKLALLPDLYQTACMTHAVDVRELEARTHAALRDPALYPPIPQLGVESTQHDDPS